MAKIMLCPLCHKKSHALHMPFCSQRCTDEDLGRWFAGKYTVPVVEEEEYDAEALAEAEARN